MRFILVATLFAVAFSAPASETLSADVDRLKLLAGSEIQKLASEGKSFLAKELQVIENEIVFVEKKLESLNPSTELGRIGVNALKTVLHALETKLEGELKKLSSGAYYDGTKEALGEHVNQLKTLADIGIKQLASEGKSFLAKELQVIENEIVFVEKKLESLNPSTELGRIGVNALKTVLHALETKLEGELKKLSTGAYYDGTKEALGEHVTLLKQLAGSEIQKLASEGKSFLAKELQVIENEILFVEKKLESLNPSTELGRIGVNALKTVLHALETKLEGELKKLSSAAF